jgi:hypothetical protein
MLPPIITRKRKRKKKGEKPPDTQNTIRGLRPDKENKQAATPEV